MTYIDVPAFTVIDDYNVKDKNGIYHYDTYRESSDYFTKQNKMFISIKNADSGSIESLAYGYAKDKNAAYFEWQKLTGADPQTFDVFMENELLTGANYFAKDGKSVYINQKIFEKADNSTFKIFNEKYTS